MAEAATTTAPDAPSPRLGRWPLVAFVVPLCVYIWCLCPTIHLGDSGELAVGATTLSIPHVPGYPVMTQAGFLVTRLPVGSLAFRANLYSAFTGALACVFIYLLLLRLARSASLALGLTLAFAFGQMFMEQSLKIRTYPLNTAFAALMIERTLAWRESGDRRALLVAAFVGGLGMGNHQVLLAAGMFPVVVIASRWRALNPRELGLAAAFFVVGLTVYAYLPLRAMAGPVLNWGDPYNAPRFLAALTQKQYSQKMLNPDWGPKLAMAGMVLKSLVTQAGVAVFALGLFGAALLARSDRVLLAALGAVIVANIALRVNYIGEDEFFQVLRYTINSTLAVTLAAAVGLSHLARRLRPSFATALMIAMVATNLALALPADNLARHRVAEDFAKAALSYPEEPYALVTGGDANIFPLWYFQRVERYREDVVPLPRAGFQEDWILSETVEKLPPGAANPREEYRGASSAMLYSTVDNLAEAGYPVYSMFSSTERAGESAVWTAWRESGRIAPCGMGFRIDGRACDESIWRRLPLSAYIEPSIPRDHHTLDVLDNVAFHLRARAVRLAKTGEWDAALGSAEAATRVLPDDARTREFFDRLERGARQ